MVLKKAFTMIELVFVIVIIGILSAVAIPKLVVTRDDAMIARAKATVASVRNAIATERQRRILRGDFAPINDLAFANGVNQPIFDFYDTNNTVGNEVLQYPFTSCATNARGCWISTNDTTYIYRIVGSANDVIFTLDNQGRLTCNAIGNTGGYCRLLTE